MKLLLYLAYFLFIWMFLFGRIEVNGSDNVNIFTRAIACFIASAIIIITFILSLPWFVILGIISLFT